jgi:hypothetical protein
MGAIRDWGLYTLVYDRKAADLIILARKGMLEPATGSMSTPRPACRIP